MDKANLRMILLKGVLLSFEDPNEVSCPRKNGSNGQPGKSATPIICAFITPSIFHKFNLVDRKYYIIFVGPPLAMNPLLRSTTAPNINLQSSLNTEEVT
jgi:hypothetical protein